MGRHLTAADDVVLGQEIFQTAQSIAEGLQQLVRRGMVFFQLFQDLLRRLVGIELGRVSLNACWFIRRLAMPISSRRASGMSTLFIIKKLLAEVVRADAEIAMSLWF